MQEVQVRLLTGRTHQVRGQLGFSGSPIVGDHMYTSALTRSLDLRGGAATNLTGTELERHLDQLLARMQLLTFVESPWLCLEAAELRFPLPRRSGAGGGADLYRLVQNPIGKCRGDLRQPQYPSLPYFWSKIWADPGSGRAAEAATGKDHHRLVLPNWHEWRGLATLSGSF